MEKEKAIQCLEKIIYVMTDDQYGYLIGAINYLKNYIYSQE